MSPAAGTTSELYSEADNPNSTLGAPPAALAPVPPPTKVEVTQPVVVKQRMADEKPDGSIRDTSTEAVTQPGRDLGFRNLDDEQAPKPAEATPPTEKPAETKPPETKPPEPPKETPPVEKVYAGKFKSDADLEKGYLELEKKLTQTAQENAALKKAPPPAPVVKTPEQVAAEQAAANEFLAEFVADPKKVITKFQQDAIEQTRVALTAQQVAEQWRKDNPDLAEHEIRVAYEATILTQSDPELAKDPAALIKKATDNFRVFTGKIRTEGAKEALTTETRTIPLLNNTAPAPTTEQPPQKAPQTQSDITDAHVAWLKTQEQRSHRGLRR